MILQQTVCILINSLQFIHQSIKLSFISSFGCFPKQLSDQNTRMIFPKIIIEVFAANPILILWPIINEGLHQPL